MKMTSMATRASIVHDQRLPSLRAAEPGREGAVVQGVASDIWAFPPKLPCKGALFIHISECLKDSLMSPHFIDRETEAQEG